MLIEFSLENYRSFRERQTFSMVAGTSTESAHPNRAAESGFSVAPKVLRQACLFGANGSGKSSLIDGMNFMSHFVRSSFRNEAGATIDVEPFLFHSEWRKKPSEFEVIFIHEAILYQYGFSLTHERIIEEWLFARPQSTGRQRQLFTRIFDPKNNNYEWNISNEHMKGERDSWKSQTRPDALFISTAMQLNAESVKGPYEWLTNAFRHLNEENKSYIGYEFTARNCLDQKFKSRILSFMAEADISIHDLSVEELKAPSSFGSKLPKDAPEHVVNLLSAMEQFERASKRTDVFIQTIRLDEQNQSVPLAYREESSGTKSLFELAGPLIDVLDNGLTLIVDELNSGLHPLAFQHLVSAFCNPELNKHNAQLIFTTHDTSVTESNCIGRDQIWFVEKSDDLASTLTPYSDYKTRNARSFQKGYLQGRYGGIPRIAG